MASSDRKVMRNQLLKACRTVNKYAIKRRLKGADVNFRKDGSTSISAVLEKLKRPFLKRTRELSDLAHIIIDLIDAGADVNSALEDGSTALHIACSVVQPNFVNRLIERGANVNSTTLKKNTPLHVALTDFRSCIPEHRLKILRALLKAGSCVNAENGGCLTPLHLACSDKNPQVVAIFIQYGADTNVLENLIETISKALCKLPYGSSAVFVEALIAVGADVNYTYINGRTMLHNTCELIDFKSVRLLIESGAVVNIADREGLTPLHLACSIGDQAIIVLLLEGGADVTSVNENNETPLSTLSITYFSRSLLVALINVVQDVNISLKNERTLLHEACEYGYSDIIMLLLDKGAIVNRCDSNMETPLHYVLKIHTILKTFCFNRGYDSLGRTQMWTSFSRRHAALVTTLLEHGANVKARNRDGSTPLHLACKHGHAESARLLIQHGADIHTLDTMNEPPVLQFLEGQFTLYKPEEDRRMLLHSACRTKDTDAVKLLVDMGADVNALDDRRKAPLHVVLSEGLLECERDVELVKSLLDGGADINMRDQRGFYPLHLFILAENFYKMFTYSEKHKRRTHNETKVDKGFLSFLSMLVHAGADINAVDRDRCTPLHLACQRKRPFSGKSVLSGQVDAIVRALLEHGADVKATFKDGSTLLHLACKHGHCDFALLLIQFGADIQSLDNMNKTAFCKIHDRQVSKGLVKAFGEACLDPATITKDGSTLLHLASKKQDSETVRLLIGMGADVNVLDRRGEAPLHRALSKGVLECYESLELVTSLVEAGADVQMCDPKGRHPVHLIFSAYPSRYTNLACGVSNELNQKNDNICANLLSTLVHAGADVNTVDENGCTPLHLACSLKTTIVAKTLIQLEADVNAKNKEGESPLHITGRRDSDKRCLAKMLLEAGADVDAKDTKGCTVLSFAHTFSTYDPEFVEFLLSKNADTSFLGDSSFLGPTSFRCGIDHVGRLLEYDLLIPTYFNSIFNSKIDALSMHAIGCRAGMNCINRIQKDILGLLNGRNSFQQISLNLLACYVSFIMVAKPGTFFSFKREAQETISKFRTPKELQIEIEKFPCPPTLKIWSVAAIRSRLCEVSGGRSILPRIKALGDVLPPALIQSLRLAEETERVLILCQKELPGVNANSESKAKSKQIQFGSYFDILEDLYYDNGAEYMYGVTWAYDIDSDSSSDNSLSDSRPYLFSYYDPFSD